METDIVTQAKNVIKKYKKEIVIENAILTAKGQIFLVLSRLPNFVYEKKGNLLIANDSGFYDTLGIDTSSSGAFGGRKFDIPLIDGTVYQAHGQVWSSGQNHIPEPYCSLGVGTTETLKKCYVYSSACISKAILDKWMETHTPLTDYFEYEKVLKEQV